mgnify:CR=1 FL=1
MKLVVATRNEGKRREIEALLTGSGLEIFSLTQYPDAPEADEPFDTFRENAAQKALLTAQYTGELAVADDSGLMVDALRGAPGVKSSRIANSDPERITWILEQLGQTPTELRTARFVCSIVLASPEGVWYQTDHCVEGIITFEPMGENGFGFDPVFYYPPLERTFAQLNQEEKSVVSHRGKALRAFCQACIEGNMLVDYPM